MEFDLFMSSDHRELSVVPEKNERFITFCLFFTKLFGSSHIF